MKVNIVGLGIGWENAPKNELTYGVNELILRRPVDVTFDMHDLPAILSGKKKQKRRTLEKLERQIEKIRETKSLMYSLKAWPELPCECYPIGAVVERFKTTFFTSTVDYAFAFAMIEDFSEIHLYGVNFSSGYEYRKQLPGLHYWIGRAQQTGVRVIVHNKKFSKVMRLPFVYGYELTQDELLRWELSSDSAPGDVASVH